MCSQAARIGSSFATKTPAPSSMAHCKHERLVFPRRSTISANWRLPRALCALLESTVPGKEYSYRSPAYVTKFATNKWRRGTAVIPESEVAPKHGCEVHVLPRFANCAQSYRDFYYTTFPQASATVV
jgi:hypothetical protein